MATMMTNEVIRAVDAESRNDRDYLILKPECVYVGRERVCSPQSLYSYAFKCRAELSALGVSVIADPGIIRLVWRN